MQRCLIPAPFAGLTCIFAACSSDPAPTCRNPTVLIRKDRVDPQLPGTYRWNVAMMAVFQFGLGEVTTSCLHQPLRYAWYFDIPVTPQVLDTYAICSSSAKCSVQLCGKPNNAQPDHSVLAVVSTGPLKPDAKGPYDFESGVVFDSVEWHIKKAGECQ
jgi:hypothetical protein